MTAVVMDNIQLTLITINIVCEVRDGQSEGDLNIESKKF